MMRLRPKLSPQLNTGPALAAKAKPHPRPLISHYGLATPSSPKLEDQLQRATLHHIGVRTITHNGRMLRNVPKSNTIIIDVHASNLKLERSGNGNPYSGAVDRIRAMAMPSSALFSTPRCRILKDVPRSLFIETSGHL